MSWNISVYIPSYNQKQYLIEAIESVLKQTVKPYQVVIVDDCSTDGSQEVIARFVAQYPSLIEPIYHTRNQGIAQTRVDALQAVKGDYVTYVDGDDRFLPTKLEKELAYLQAHPKARIAFSDHYFITANGRRMSAWAESEKPQQGDVFCQVFSRNFPKATLFRSELVDYQAWRKIGFYDPHLCLYEDYEMRIRLTKHLQVVYYDEPLSEKRIGIGGLSTLQAPYHLTALEYIFRKNSQLLDDLPLEKQKKIKDLCKNLLGFMSHQALQTYIDQIENSLPLSHKIRAVQCYLKRIRYREESFNYKFMLQIITPPSLFFKLQSLYRFIRSPNDSV